MGQISTCNKNGNITTLQRLGNTIANPDLSTNTGFGTMDNLSYTYDSGNKLQKVADSGASNFGFVDGADTATEYTYDLPAAGRCQW